MAPVSLLPYSSPRVSDKQAFTSEIDTIDREDKVLTKTSGDLCNISRLIAKLLIGVSQ